MDRKDKSRSRSSTSSAAASMAALAAAAAAGEGSSSGSGDGALPPSKQEHGEEHTKPAKLAAVGGASSSSPVPARRATAGGGPRCQAERCNADLNDAGQYNRRHKVCQTHFKAAVVLVAGLRQRFCQQCSRFHELSEFDETRRSCRLRLVGHNERRRRGSANTHGTGAAGSSSSGSGSGGGAGGGDGCRHADQDGRGPQGNPPPNHFQIR